MVCGDAPDTAVGLTARLQEGGVRSENRRRSRWKTSQRRRPFCKWLIVDRYSVYAADQLFRKGVGYKLYKVI